MGVIRVRRGTAKFVPGLRRILTRKILTRKLMTQRIFMRKKIDTNNSDGNNIDWTIKYCIKSKRGTANFVPGLIKILMRKILKQRILMGEN